MKKSLFSPHPVFQQIFESSLLPSESDFAVCCYRCSSWTHWQRTRPRTVRTRRASWSVSPPGFSTPTALSSSQQSRWAIHIGSNRAWCADIACHTDRHNASSCIGDPKSHSGLLLTIAVAGRSSAARRCHAPSELRSIGGLCGI